MKVKLKDVVIRINNNIDRFNTDIKYYLGKGHGECGEIAITERGDLKADVGMLGFKFHFAFQPKDTLFFSRSFALRKAGMAMYEGLCSDSTYILRTKDESILLPTYLPAVLQSESFWEYCDTNHTGGVNFLINWSTLADYEFELPSIEEQRVLADKLWAAYELKEAYKKMIAATDEMVKSQFIEMFGDPIAWQNDKSLPVLSDTVNIVSGFPFDAELFNADGNGAVLIRIRDIQRGYSETYTTESFDEQYRIKKSELLIGMDGMFEIARWQSEDAALNQRVCCLRMKGGENDTFIQYLVQPILKHIEVGTNATTVKHLSVKQINAIRIPIATDAQKNEFALIVEQADKSKFELRQAIEKIDKVMKSLIN